MGVRCDLDWSASHLEIKSRLPKVTLLFIFLIHKRMVHTLDKLALMAENKIPASVSGIFASFQQTL